MYIYIQLDSHVRFKCWFRKIHLKFKLRYMLVGVCILFSEDVTCSVHVALVASG